MRPVLRHLPYLLRRTLVASIDDGLFGLAKGAAYSALLSFFPVLTSAATILVQVRAEYGQDKLTRYLPPILAAGHRIYALAVGGIERRQKPDRRL